MSLAEKLIRRYIDKGDPSVVLQIRNGSGCQGSCKREVLKFAEGGGDRTIPEVVAFWFGYCRSKNHEKPRHQFRNSFLRTVSIALLKTAGAPAFTSGCLGADCSNTDCSRLQCGGHVKSGSLADGLIPRTEPDGRKVYSGPEHKPWPFG